LITVSSGVQSRSTISSLSPEVQIENIPCNGTTVWVAREDLLPGGTKQRACAFLLEHLAAKGYKTVIYASPFCGFAQVCLAYVCKHFDIGCTLVCERDRSQPVNASPTVSRGGFHPLSKLAESYGATLLLADDLIQAERIAADLSSRSRDTFDIPLGLDCGVFRTAMAAALKLQWETIVHKLSFVPSTLWLPLGSGTLTRCFSQVINSRKTRIRCVDIHVLDEKDERIQSIRNDLSSIEMFSASERFQEPSRYVAPVPSNIFYDAKVWCFLEKYAEEDHLWWNVAR
jgi:1-aminocyclopropane-1-carboxylate deaminase/D-cysteine desulfhydrase-like pyridoxal-dependent ACC family enzyme